MDQEILAAACASVGADPQCPYIAEEAEECLKDLRRIVDFRLTQEVSPGGPRFYICALDPAPERGIKLKETSWELSSFLTKDPLYNAFSEVFALTRVRVVPRWFGDKYLRAPGNQQRKRAAPDN